MQIIMPYTKSLNGPLSTADIEQKSVYEKKKF